MFKDVLKKLRDEKGLTQEELAEALGVRPGAIGNYEQGQRLPKDDKMWIKIAKFFNVTVDYLMDVENSIEKNEIKIIAADAISPSPTVIGTTPKTDPLQQKRNELADRIRNSDYTNEELDKIEQMLDIVVSR